MISLAIARRPWVLAAAVFFCFTLILFSSRTDRAQKWTTAVKKIADHNAPPPSQRNAARIHLIIPAADADVNICKAVLSASLLGYGAPTLFNWESSNEQMAKISGALNYLDSLEEAQGEDLVLMVEASELWFQLPAKILIDRYHTINADANERIHSMASDSPAKGAYEAPEQKIIFAAQKRCWPGDVVDISCQSVPESPLPDDLYGPKTDEVTKDEFNPYAKVRARWLNSGVILGPAKEMRDMFERAQELGQFDLDTEGHEKAVFNRIFGEQEHQRAVSRLVPRGETPESFIPEPGKNYEFGIGLDYESALTMPTVYAEYDSAFVTFSKNETVEAAIKAARTKNTRIQSLDADVSAIDPPFSVLANHVHPPKPWMWYENTSTPWEDVPLYTNLYTGITPAIILHNAHKKNLKSRLVEWWNKIWFQPMAWNLLDASMLQPEGATAVDKQGRQWFNAINRMTVKMEGFGVQVDDGRGERGWMPWEELCSEEAHSEIFRDGRGVYQEDRRAGG